ncbi:DUF4129 domain-containing protein [Jiangella alkaliphila]|uniref:Protein-glutamine gamma-glutamyltransferase-like C-terminal domain-containing protein n=1 Tax=Jiangella alkaliphila TaxID=419479 RepID=A0A1H2JUP8_9ACTN|nr:DUF4129 domain-containing protein [Jiangella alkaliphila]SDU60177.1 protein of unknown function [Jiangella alkaliphila]
MHWSERRPTGGPLAAAVVAVAALVVVLALAAGPVDVVEPGWFSVDEPSTEIELDPLPTAEMEQTAPPRSGDEPGGVDVPWPIVLAIAAAAAAYLAYYVLRRLVPELRARAARRRAALGGHVEALGDPADEAAELRDGARSAATALAGPAPDAVEAIVAAWLALESAAAGSGAPRDPAQTPTEFTAALLRRHHADEDAVAMLLALYHRARFALRPGLGDEDVAAARRALETVVGTLGTADAR